MSTTNQESRVLFGRSASTIKSKAVHWIWHPFIPDAKVSELAGDPDRGKSILLVEIAAHVSTGTPWFDWSDCPLGHVLLLSSEDDFDDTVVPRLVAASADLSNVTLISTRVEVIDKDGSTRRVRFTLPLHIQILENKIKAKGAKLVVIDALVSFLDHGMNTSRDTAAREVIDALKEVAARTGCAILVLRHLNKDANAGGNPLNRIGGSTSFSAAARASHLIDFDPTDDNPNEGARRRVLLRLKNNNSAPTDGLVFKLDVVPFTCDSGEVTEVPTIEWCGATKLTAAQLMLQQQRRARGETPKDESNRAREAIDFLRLTLATGPRPMREVQSDALALDINARTLRRAREKLHIEAIKPKGKKDGPWCWRLPAINANGTSPAPHPPHTNGKSASNVVPLRPSAVREDDQLS
jgi:putative DNA primase/helicase